MNKVKPIGAATPAFDSRKYARLLAKSLPMAIKTEEENERMLAEVSKLMSKGEDNLTPEENVLLETMAILIEEFERHFYKIEDAPCETL